MSMHLAKNLNDHVRYQNKHVISIRTKKKIMKSMYGIVKNFFAMLQQVEYITPKF